jgi:hypothetical protein
MEEGKRLAEKPGKLCGKTEKPGTKSEKTGGKMKKSILFIGIFSLLSLLLVAKAEIKFEKLEINFGEIDEGQTVDLVFKFKNTGDSLLVINNIRSTCGCTVPQLKKRRFKPGEEGNIPVKFISRGYGGRKVYKRIVVNSNAPEHPSVRLKIEGSVILKNFARIEISPKEIILKTNSRGKEYSQYFYIKNTGNMDLEIKELTHIPEIIPVFSSSVIKPGQQEKVEVMFKPMHQSKNVSFLRIRTNDYRNYFSLLKILIK